MSHYFCSEEGGERSVCLAFGFLCLLVAMLVLVVREDYLEFGLEPGFSSLFDNLEIFVKQQGYADWSYVSPWKDYFWLKYWPVVFKEMLVAVKLIYIKSYMSWVIFQLAQEWAWLCLISVLEVALLKYWCHLLLVVALNSESQWLSWQWSLVWLLSAPTSELSWPSLDCGWLKLTWMRCRWTQTVHSSSKNCYMKNSMCFMSFITTH